MLSVRPLLDLDVDNINNPLNPDRLQTAKHAIPHSRSTSPVKKKMKKDLSRDEKLKAYKLFVIAERPRLQTEFTSIEGKISPNPVDNASTNSLQGLRLATYSPIYGTA
jgi:hypothetical protein